MLDQEEISLSRRTLLAGAVVLGVTGSMLGSGTAMADGEAAPKNMGPAVDLSKLEHVQVELVAPPFVHAHEQRAKGKPKVVQFRMVIEEKKQVIDDDGTEIHAMTFNGSVPGPMMVVHQDDYLELTLVNPASNTLTHNIDFHASTGALGGGALTIIQPGEEVKLRFRATRPGVFVYHCAPGGAMIPWHVVSGMNGAIMVLPRDGLKDRDGKALKYDKVVYIGEQDFYVPRDKDGNFKRYGTPMESYNDMQQVMKGLIPSHIVFNGKVGALTGKNALKANVGETLLIVHSQANRDTRPHLIGGHGDHVWATGKFNNPPEEDLETWFIPGGAAGAALYTFLQPGLYTYLNHNLIEAVLLGAAAHIQVEGQWNNDLMSQIQPPTAIK
ncbi:MULTISPECIES: copper-containing nitrite reductase [Pseudomonas]|uniref:Copper-containing nitrite reductase n=1 Tax=Pseudomonas nitroreducens TaxID=46680 RepID=A0A6G6J5Z8_PSENT|nr:nitrite reductase, copper-containing [Pseudomonas nitroreducens]NMZ76163.1 nitrite reductase, copper-containing [Pseudomonas nitroreducens]QIE90623.1 nitrite reductase, copper-containing [Pseudomonas nitroreducens]